MTYRLTGVFLCGQNLRSSFKECRVKAPEYGEKERSNGGRERQISKDGGQRPNSLKCIGKVKKG